jgi:hypothetical protein
MRYRHSGTAAQRKQAATPAPPLPDASNDYKDRELMHGGHRAIPRLRGVGEGSSTLSSTQNPQVRGSPSLANMPV